MTADLASLSVAAVTIGFFHCLFGPDHYIPFVAMSRVGVWSLRKTILVTLFCGIGHVASSALLGFLGIALGLLVLQLELAESFRGDLAAWLLTSFGAGYTLWGLWYALQRPEHSGPAGHHHSHHHRHLEQGAGAPQQEAGAESADASRPGRWTPWILFTVFLFGPCEPLIPLLMYPAAKANVWSVLCVTLLFGITTLMTMTSLVVLGYWGLFALQGPNLERWAHAAAGVVVLGCGLAVLAGF